MTAPQQGGDRTGGRVNLPLLVLARICTTTVFMTYPACLSVLLEQWQMTATRAGLVQTLFTAGLAVSLLGLSVLADRVGARRVFQWASAASALAALAFAAFARSFETAAPLMVLLGLSQGGTYTPAIMLAAANVPARRKAAAVGWVLAGMSAGYVVSIALSSGLLALYGYEAAFLGTAAVTLLGWAFGHVAVRHAQDRPARGRTATERPAAAHAGASTRRARLLTLGYIGHTWELLGAWAWIPAFLAAAVLSDGAMSPIALGLWTAVALHLSGFFASFLSGHAADRFGARPVLVGFALAGLLCSLTIGWLPQLGAALLLALTALYGFATIGDSAVLSSAMTDAVAPDRLGRVLGLRSVLGVGAGALAPAAFGLALDHSPAALAWGMAFSTLALGGALALLCAVLLRPA